MREYGLWVAREHIHGDIHSLGPTQPIEKLDEPKPEEARGAGKKEGATIKVYALRLIAQSFEIVIERARAVQHPLGGGHSGHHSFGFLS